MDFKKLFIFLLVLAGVGCLFVFIFNGSLNSKKVSDKEREEIQAFIDNYVSTFTTGAFSQYGGTDLLYANDKTTYSELAPTAVLNSATRYASKKLNSSIENSTIDMLSRDYKYDMTKIVAYKGEDVRKAIKELFDIDYKDTSIQGAPVYGFDYTYVPSVDVYLKSKNSSYAQPDGKHVINTKTLKIAKKKNTYTVDIIVAYIFSINKDLVYTSDANGNEIVYKTQEYNEEINEEYTDKFTKYTITIDKNDSYYTFKSIEKTK